MAETDPNDLDFTQPPRRSWGYNPILTRMCFNSLGTEETMPEGGCFFVENQMGDKMYLLIEGEVGLRRGTRSLDIVKRDELFGEMAVIAHRPRSASAVARIPCRVLSLDARQCQHAIQQTPEFGVMLMNIMIKRLRLSFFTLSMTRSLPDWREVAETKVLDEKLLAEFVRALQERPPLHYPVHKVIMKAEETGVFMYVVLEGRVAVSVESQVVERIGPGGVFGEMALAEQSTRVANAVAETACVLLPVNRNDVLDLIKSRPEIAMSLLRAIAERLRHMDTGYK
ncbi:MAG: cyclic nucleotide-binding domain-containing protein [Betaproteobacteria bacterium]|nr:cyclic nucleotide-binding domain-containing protein [Betaproteobacteria bacterium]MDH3438130.1 cyclic nucleotide-binding domain-containing protein [Betaproteobacteria bacterium]